MPTFEVTDSETGITLELTGDSPPTEAELIEIFATVTTKAPPTVQPAPQQGITGKFTDALSRTLGLPVDIVTSVLNTLGADIQAPIGGAETFRGPVELAANIAELVPAEIVGGLAGTVQALNPFAQPGAGAEAVRAVQDVVPPLGQAGQQLVKSVVDVIPETVKEGTKFAIEQFKSAEDQTLEKFGPLAATVLTTLPIFALEAVPGSIALKKSRNLQVTKADEVIEEAGDAAREAVPDSIKAGIPPEAKTYTQIEENLKSRKIAAIAEAVRPDPEILASAEALGVDLNPSHYSTNRAFIDIEQAIKSTAGSKLGVIEEKAIIDLGISADNLIEELGGAFDKAEIDIKVKETLTKEINKLETKSDKLFKLVEDTIPDGTRIIPASTQRLLEKTRGKLGDPENILKDPTLSTAEKKVFKLVENINQNPTYDQLDRVRKDIGRALGEKSSPFKDDNRGTLKQLYSVLTEDQQGAAESFKVGSEYQLGRKLVASRKVLEKEATSLFSKNMEGSILPEGGIAMRALAKQNVSKFKKMMNAVPSNMRQEVAATLLNDIFNTTARVQTGGVAPSFVKAFNGINRSPIAKNELFKHFPPEGRKVFDDIGRVATGIFRSKALENTSKSARDVLFGIESGTMIEKLFVKTVGAAAKIPGAGGTVRTVGDIVSNAKTPAVQVADDLLTSPTFKKAVEMAAAGDVVGAERLIFKNSRFVKWAKQQSPDVKKEINEIGFISWLVLPDNGNGNGMIDTFNELNDF